MPWNEGSERTSLASLYERHVGRAVALATVLTGDASSAEDIAQDCFVRVAARMGSLGGDVRFEAYYQRAVVNACRSRHRRLMVERSFLARVPGHRHVAPPPELPLDDAIARALRELPRRQRAAVALRFLEDLSEEQTAHVLRCSPRAVNALVSRALATLRTQVHKEDP